MNLNPTPPKPMSLFQKVREIMLQPSPLSDQDIEDLLHQEAANQVFQLPADEQPTDNQPTYIETN